MAMLSNPQANIIRLGRATNIRYDQGVLDLTWLDRVTGTRKNVPFTQPYLGRGWGIHCGIEEGSICVVGLQENKPFILAFLPHSAFYRSDITEQPQTGLDESRYVIAKRGEIALQSKANSVIFLDQAGSIEASTPQGNTIRIDNETNTIGQVSAQRFVQSEAGELNIGQVLRDIRSPEERINDVIFSGFEDLQSSGVFNRIVGVDPQQDVVLQNTDPPRGLFNPQEGNKGTLNNATALANPALTEWDFRATELSDGNIGLDNAELTTEQKIAGFLSQNTLARITLGTLTNEIGKQLRFDYGFGIGGQGHGNIFAHQQFFDNTSGYSTDRKFNAFNTISVSQNNPSEFEWTLSRLEEASFATAFRFLLHSKGADYRGQREAVNFSGSYWGLQIDKEGFTKLNIPAATDGGIVDEETGLVVERFRRGRSLLANLEGSATIAIGKENTTTLQTDTNGFSIDDGLKGLTESPLVNRRNSREDRSLTLDALGNIEAIIGGDGKANQSIMLQTDGSISMLVGKENKAPEDGFAILTEAYDDAGQGREGRSFTASLLGNLELLIGRDESAQQSIMIETLGRNVFRFGHDDRRKESMDLSTSGGNNFSFGANIDGNSVQLRTDGGLRIQIQGVNNNEYSLELTAAGNLKIITEGNIEVEAKETFITGDLKVQGDIWLGDFEATEDAVKGVSLSQYLVTHTHGNGNFGGDTTPPLQAPNSIFSDKVKLV